MGDRTERKNETSSSSSSLFSSGAIVRLSVRVPVRGGGDCIHHGEGEGAGIGAVLVG